jgi:hypothetical protein
MITVAYISGDPGAEVTYVGPIGTRHCDIDKLVRRLQSKAEEELVFIYEAGPYGYLCHVQFYEGLGGEAPTGLLD